MLVKILKQSYLLLMCLSTMVNAEEHENLAKSLAKVRGEVEELQVELDLAKENHRNQTNSRSWARYPQSLPGRLPA